MSQNQQVQPVDFVLRLDIKQFVQYWNARYPIDRYIRKKYNIAFGSTEHRALDFVSMTIEYVEDKLVVAAERESMQLTEADLPDGEKLNRRVYEGNQGPAEVIKMNRRAVDSEFENLDLTKF
jgi:hypothetical protein